MYTIILEEPAKRFIRKLDKSEKNRVLNKIEKLKENPHLGKPLVGDLAGLRSLRIGYYRAVYQIHDNKLVVVVLEVGHRKKVYRK